MNQKETIPVFFSADNKYAPYLGVALNSLITNASEDYDYRLIVLCDDLSQENREKIKKLEKPGFQIDFIPMHDKLSAFSDHNRLRCDYFTLTIYFRLFIPALFPEYDKGIYMDSDTVVPGDISQLYRLEMGESLIGVCVDYSVQEAAPLTFYIDKAVGVDHTKYFNSGVLLMNLRALRDARLDERFLSLLETYHFDSVAPDQDYLNAMCHDRLLYLSEEWDAMPNDHKSPLPCPKLIHYNLFAKPWCYDNIQYEEYFWHYAKSSGYYEEILAFKAEYSDEQKRFDQSCMEAMVARALEIVKSGTTFASAFNTGLEKRL